MSEMRNKLVSLIWQENLGEYIVDSFEAARDNDRRKNIVLLDDGIYLTFKADVDDRTNVFGELICWVDDEFNEDPEIYAVAANAAHEMFSYTDEELNAHIINNDIVWNFVPYDQG